MRSPITINYVVLRVEGTTLGSNVVISLMTHPYKTIYLTFLAKQVDPGRLTNPKREARFLHHRQNDVLSCEDCRVGLSPYLPGRIDLRIESECV